MKKQKWTIFISGNGSNLQTLLDDVDHIEVNLVVSNKSDAFGLERAKRAQVPTLVLPKKIDWAQLSEELKKNKTEKIFLLGFMKILPAEFVYEWRGRIINLHPSLLPSYKGAHAIEESFRDRGDMGVTIHVVTPELDSGPMIEQQLVLSADELASRCISFEKAKEMIHLAEHRLVRKVARSWNP